MIAYYFVGLLVTMALAVVFIPIVVGMFRDEGAKHVRQRPRQTIHHLRSDSERASTAA